jgi:hypothetical protein
MSIGLIAVYLSKLNPLSGSRAWRFETASPKALHKNLRQLASIFTICFPKFRHLNPVLSSLSRQAEYLLPVHNKKNKAKQSRYTPWWRFEGEKVYLLLIVELGIRWGWLVSVTPRPRFGPGKGPPVPIVQEAGWAPQPVWTQRSEEKSFRLCRGSNLHRPVV